MSSDTARRFSDTLQIRFEPDMLGDVDAHLTRMREKTPSLQISRSDAVRDLVLRGLKDAGRAR
jgi:hypothetical protein